MMRAVLGVIAGYAAWTVMGRIMGLFGSRPTSVGASAWQIAALQTRHNTQAANSPARNGFMTSPSLSFFFLDGATENQESICTPLSMDRRTQMATKKGI